jgi:hypothetical protein
MDYSKTKIYKIYSNLGDNIYIGSTTKDRLCDRMAKHRSSYKLWKNGSGSHIRSFDLFDLYGIENCIIELIEAKECTNKEDKNKLEGKYIREIECVNKNITGRTIKEHYKDNIEEFSRKNKEYREANKDKVKEYGLNYRNNNKDKFKEYQKEIIECPICKKNIRKGNKSRHNKIHI